MKAILVGAVESSGVALRALARSKAVDLIAVVTLPAALAKRHSDFHDLRPDAKAAGAEVIEAANSNAPEVVDRLKSLKPDLGFVIGWSQILKAPFRDVFPKGIVGYHPAPLPQLRGRAVIPWTILLERTITAGSLFWVDDGVDSGPLAAQEFFHVASDETATTLYAKHVEALERMLDERLPEIASANPPRIVQDERYASWTTRRTPEDSRIDWSAPAPDVLRLIRAATRPYPGAFSTIGAEKVTIWRAGVWPEGRRYSAVPGQIILLNDRGFAARCGDGAIFVDAWSAPDGVTLRAHDVFGRREG
jgi:methionyl-tRNA formyltransferase